MSAVLDQHGISLTPEVVMARQAAEQVEKMIEIHGGKPFELKMLGGPRRSNPQEWVDAIDMILPADFAPLMLKALRMVGEGFGVNIQAIVPLNYPRPNNPQPTHNDERLGGWQKCACDICAARRRIG